MPTFLIRIAQITQLLLGFNYVRQNKWTWKYFAILIVLNLILFFLAFVTILLATYSLMDIIFNLLDINLPRFFDYLTNFFITIIAFYLATVVFNAISTIVSSPIYGIMTDKVLEKNFSYPESSTNFIETIYVTMVYELKKFILFITFLILSFTLNFIPIIGSVLFILINLLQLIVFAGLDFFDPIFVKENKKLQQRVTTIIGKPVKYWTYLGTGGFLCSIPIINIFLIPIFTIGGILLYLGYKKQ